jgi:hypothetical protein
MKLYSRIPLLALNVAWLGAELFRGAPIERGHTNQSEFVTNYAGRETSAGRDCHYQCHCDKRFR